MTAAWEAPDDMGLTNANVTAAASRWPRPARGDGVMARFRPGSTMSPVYRFVGVSSEHFDAVAAGR
jgi:hypothetical protein